MRSRVYKVIDGLSFFVFLVPCTSVDRFLVLVDNLG